MVVDLVCRIIYNCCDKIYYAQLLTITLYCTLLINASVFKLTKYIKMYNYILQRFVIYVYIISTQDIV